MMLQAVLPWAMAAFALGIVLNAWRLLRGPAQVDRILALDTLSVNALALLVLHGLRVDSRLNLEVALVIALLGFIGSAVLARHATHLPPEQA